MSDQGAEPDRWLEIRGREDNGPKVLVGFDELVATGCNVHIERMNSGHYWMRLEKGSEGQRIEFWAKGGRLYSGTERE